MPTLTGRWRGGRGHWPVLLPVHVDRDPGEVVGPWPHLHVDWRFVAPNMLRAKNHHLPLVHQSVLIVTARTAPLVWRRRTCHRTELVHGLAHLIAVTQRRLAGRQCRHDGRGWTCPHRGASLVTFAPDQDGVVTCPLHGLRIDAATGRVRDLGS